MTNPRPAFVLPSLAVAAVTASLALAFFYAPTEALQGEVQRILYIHAPSAWIAYLAFGIVAVASLVVIVRPASWERWDAVAVSAAELGLLFASIVLLTGPVWARPVWGTWWAWDARLTSTLVLWVIYAGYLIFRALAAPGVRRARLAAVAGLVGAIDVPIIHFSVTWWRTQHPAPSVIRPRPTLPGSMLVTLLVSMAAYTLLFVVLLRARTAIETSRARVDALADA
jgi:heme exporter protein C